jgi:cytochrome c oxidase assembly protein subunit 16
MFATTAKMATFQSNKFRSSADANKLGMKYRALMNKHPFIMFGLPFLAVIISGSFVLTPATAVRYEKHDRKVRQMTKEEELNVRRSPRKVDMREEYYVSFRTPCGMVFCVRRVTDACSVLLGGTWRTGSRRGWNACRARVMVSCDRAPVSTASRS